MKAALRAAFRLVEPRRELSNFFVDNLMKINRFVTNASFGSL
jgi:hypothetical protein